MTDTGALKLIDGFGLNLPLSQLRPTDTATCYFDEAGWLVLTDTTGRPGRVSVPPWSPLWDVLLRWAS